MMRDWDEARWCVDVERSVALWGTTECVYVLAGPVSREHHGGNNGEHGPLEPSHWNRPADSLLSLGGDETGQDTSLATDVLTPPPRPSVRPHSLQPSHEYGFKVPVCFHGHI